MGKQIGVIIDYLTEDYQRQIDAAADGMRVAEAILRDQQSCSRK